MDSLEFDYDRPPLDIEMKKSMADDLEVPFVKEKLECDGMQQRSASDDDDDGGYHLDEYSWVPSGLQPELVLLFMRSLPETRIPYVGSVGDRYRMVQLLRQLPVQDSDVKYCHGLSDEEKKELSAFAECRRKEALGRGVIRRSDLSSEAWKCKECQGNVKPGDVSVMALRIDEDARFHPRCFVCHQCKELLVDLIYFAKDGFLFCGRHHAELIKPRCVACDELIFTEECTEAEGHTWHMKHFVCNDCEAQLGGRRYVMRDGRPICCGCYDAGHAECCHSCQLPIGISQGLMEINGRRWHATDECFQCHSCRRSLVGHRFLPKDDVLYCSVCSLIEPKLTDTDSQRNVFKAVSLDDGLNVVEPEGGSAHTRTAASRHSEGRGLLGNGDCVGQDRPGAAAVNSHRSTSLALESDHSIWKDDRDYVSHNGAKSLKNIVQSSGDGLSENLELQSVGEIPGTSERRRQVGQQVHKGALPLKSRSHGAMDERRLSKEEELIELYQSRSLHRPFVANDRQKRFSWQHFASCDSDQQNWNGEENHDDSAIQISQFQGTESKLEFVDGLEFDPVDARVLRMMRGKSHKSETLDLPRGKKSVRFDPSTKASRTPSPREEFRRRLQLQNRASAYSQEDWDAWNAGHARKQRTSGYSSDGAASKPKRSSGYFSDSTLDWSTGGYPYDGAGLNWSNGRKAGWSTHKACGQRKRKENLESGYDVFEFREEFDEDNIEKCSTCSSSSDSSDFYETSSVRRAPYDNDEHFGSPSFRKSASSYLYSENCRTLPSSSRVSFADAAGVKGKKKKKHRKTNCVVS